MSEISNPIQPGAASETPSHLLEQANQLYHEYHTRCFWHSPPDLKITEELIPFVVKGLRMYGGHRGFILAATLLDSSESCSREIPKCP